MKDFDDVDLDTVFTLDLSLEDSYVAYVASSIQLDIGLSCVSSATRKFSLLALNNCHQARSKRDYFEWFSCAPNFRELDCHEMRKSLLERLTAYQEFDNAIYNNIKQKFVEFERKEHRCFYCCAEEYGEEWYLIGRGFVGVAFFD